MTYTKEEKAAIKMFSQGLGDEEIQNTLRLSDCEIVRCEVAFLEMNEILETVEFHKECGTRIELIAGKINKQFGFKLTLESVFSIPQIEAITFDIQSVWVQQGLTRGEW